MANLLDVVAGVYADLGAVEAAIEHAEGRTRFAARLENLRAIVDRAEATVERARL